MSWEGLTTENHLGATYTENLTVAEIKERYGPVMNIDDMRAYHYQWNIMQHKIEVELQKNRDRQYEIPQSQGIRAQMESANQQGYEHLSIDELMKSIEGMIKEIGIEEQIAEMVLRTGEHGMYEFDKHMKQEERKDYTVEEWKEQLTKEMTL